MSPSEMDSLFAIPFRAGPSSDFAAFLLKLHQELVRRQNELKSAFSEETGFVTRDVDESIAGAIDMLEDYPPYQARFEQIRTSKASSRSLEIVDAPWGTIVAILPQNAFLFLGLTALTAALATGNRIVLRVPSNSRQSGILLAQAIEQCGPLRERVSLVFANAKGLLDSFYKSTEPGLVHYFGSSGRIPDLLSQAFRGGKACLADGEGNTWVYVAADADPEQAASWLAAGATRYNGQTCTSVNGAIVHPHVYTSVTEALRVRLQEADLGALAAEEHAIECLRLANDSDGRIIAGGTNAGARLEATLVLEPDPNSDLVHSGVFGPVMWISSGKEEDFAHLWKTNRYPLCAAIFGTQIDSAAWIAKLGNLARLVVNGDPSIEDALEPWGGYPGTGNGTVETWQAKYVRRVQIDRP